MVITAYILRRMNYTYWKRAWYSLTIYGIMQFTQFLNWLTIQKLENYGEECPAANRYATYLAYISIVLQPLFNILSAAAGEVNSPENRARYTLLICMSIVVVVIMLLQLIVGELWSSESSETVSTFDFSTTLDDHITCTYVGKYGYILWRFRVFQAENLPNYFVYHLFSLTVFTISNLRQFLILFFCYYVLAIYSAIEYPNSGESAAYWCKSTIAISILFLLDCWYEKKYLQKTKRSGNHKHPAEEVCSSISIAPEEDS